MPVEVLGSEIRRARPVLWRVTDRATFDGLRRRGHRARQGPLTVSFLAPPAGAAEQPPRVAFAVSKAAGGAVQRNRIRRRLRAALRELQLEGALPSGAYLVGATSSVATMPWSALVSLVRHTVAEAAR